MSARRHHLHFTSTLTSKIWVKYIDQNQPMPQWMLTEYWMMKHQSIQIFYLKQGLQQQTFASPVLEAFACSYGPRQIAAKESKHSRSKSIKKCKQDCNCTVILIINRSYKSTKQRTNPRDKCQMTWREKHQIFNSIQFNFILFRYLQA